MADYSQLPGQLTSLRQWCVRSGKQPTGFNPKTNQLENDEWQKPERWMTFEQALERSKNYDGIGFMVARNNDGLSIIGGDLDNCRNPKTGTLSAWATSILEEIKPFYTEPSISGTGIRFFVLGHLPNNEKKIDGHGSDDLSNEDREAIITAKPTAVGKINGLELYETVHHLTITGKKIAKYCFEPEDRTDAIVEAAIPFLAAKATEDIKAGNGKLPQIDILDVIDTSSFVRSGGQLLGPHPTEGSTTGKNLVVDPAKNVYCWMHNGIDAGGDAWTWLACECGAVRWEDAGPGVLRDRAVLEKTIEHAIARGFVTADQVKSNNKKTVEELIKTILSDPRNLKNSDVIQVLAALKANDPVEYDIVIESIKKAGTGIKVDTINRIVERYIKDHSEEQPTAPDEGIHEKALAIATHGDPFKFLIFQAQRNHLGDIGYQKVLIASIASASSLRSKGIQPGGNGEKGSGKSDACASVYHLMPQDRTLEGSLSPMSLFYLQETGRLKSGMVLFSDDVEYEPIIPIYKRSTARFQKGITHNTVSGGKDRHGIELTIPPRIVWWLTSVESVANEQAFDRQYPISTDSTPDHKKRVAREIAARRARKELTLSDDEGIEVARDIIRDVFDNGPFMVLIPQADKAEWTKISDFRGQEQFWDLVDALVILRWRQHKRDEDGWLIAEDKDLIEAREILTGHKVAHFADLTEAEVKLVGKMCALGRPVTQRELTEAAEVAQSTLSERLRSIMAKSAIVTEDYEAGKKVYAINPKMSVGEKYWEGVDLIDLKIADNEAYRSHQIALSGCYRYVIGIPIGIIINNSNRIPSSLSVDKELCMGETCPCTLWLKEYPFLYTPTDKTDNDRKQHQEDLSDTDKSDRYGPIRTDNDSSRPDDIPIRHTGDAANSARTNATLDEKQKQIRTACRSEFGMNGWVDPRNVASRLKYDLKDVISWLEANYIRHKELGNGIFGYTQKSTAKV